MTTAAILNFPSTFATARPSAESRRPDERRDHGALGHILPRNGGTRRSVVVKDVEISPYQI
jgi:hypothetical protein